MSGPDAEAVPQRWWQTPGPTSAVLAFRVGIADETAVARGITLTAARLVLSALPDPVRHHVAARIGPDVTTFEVRGDPEEVRDGIDAVGRVLWELDPFTVGAPAPAAADVPAADAVASADEYDEYDEYEDESDECDEYEDECDEYDEYEDEYGEYEDESDDEHEYESDDEDEVTGPGAVEQVAPWGADVLRHRYGLVGYGLVGYGLVGWSVPSLARVLPSRAGAVAWAAGRFNAGNALLALAGPTAPDLRLTLPGGRRWPLPEAHPHGSVDVSRLTTVVHDYVSADSLPLRLGVEILRHRLIDRFTVPGERRTRRTPWTSVVRIGSRSVLVVVAVNPVKRDRALVEEQVRALVVEQGERLPTAAELRAVMAGPRPRSSVGDAAGAELTDRLPWPPLGEPPHVRAEAVREAMAALAAAGPGGPPAPPAPLAAPGAAVFRSRRWRPRRELHISESAVVLVAPGAAPEGISLAECVEVRWWHDGHRVLVDRAARELAVVYAEWTDRERMLAQLDDVVPPGLFVCRDRAPMDPPAGVHPVVARLALPPVRPPRGA